jgi:hypothetical protein
MESANCNPDRWPVREDFSQSQQTDVALLKINRHREAGATFPRRRLGPAGFFNR